MIISNALSLHQASGEGSSVSDSSHSFVVAALTVSLVLILTYHLIRKPSVPHVPQKGKTFVHRKVLRHMAKFNPVRAGGSQLS